MSDSLKKKTIKGLFWSGIDKFSLEIVQFVIGVVLARLLMPSDYGVIGILMVFVTFSVLFVDGGLMTALIQKNDRTESDFNTAFIYNLCSSIAIYCILFLGSPFVAIWFENEQITWLLRVLSLNLIISAFSSVQNTRLTIDVDFKTIAKISVSSGIISGVFSILFAYLGFGVWALVVQQLMNNICKTIFLNIHSKWRPKHEFSKESFRELFGFGYKLILTNILARVYTNLYPIIIGKFYPMSTLGYYTRGQHYAVLPVNILKGMFTRVSFPILSSIKNDNDRLRNIYRIYIEQSSFVIFPIMFILIITARPLIIIMLTEKWIEAAPFMQIISLGFMFDHINAINLNLLFVKGRSDLALKLEVIKKTVAISILFISLFWGIWGICIGQAIYSILATFLNSLYTKRLIGLSYRCQVIDFGKVWFISLISAIVPFYAISLLTNEYLQMIVAFCLYVIIYITIHVILKTNSAESCMCFFNNYIKKKV